MVWFFKKYKDLIKTIAQTKEEVSDAVAICKQGENYLIEATKILDQVTKTRNEVVNTRNEIINTRSEIERLKQESTQGFPWLANALADYEHLKDENLASYLRNKPHPAYSSAAEVSRIAKEKRELIRSLKRTQYVLNYYENLFPWLQDYIDIDPEEVRVQSYSNDEIEDEVARFVSKQEYQKLSVTERNQLALDRYINTNHSKSQIGKMYERQIGYMMEQKGYTVEYKGILDGFDDLGRDLICRGSGCIYVVQCKCWASNKLIREAHINQLYGTYIKFKIEEHKHRSLFEIPIYPLFVTTTTFSDTAKEFARALNVKLWNVDINKQYPMIKCNISGHNKIYHLPFDQQYDRTKILNPGECYVATVQEAESRGFRRAKRWRSDAG